MKSRPERLIGIVIGVLAFSAVMFFLIQDLALSGRLEFQTDFKKFTPFITILKPQGQIVISDAADIKKEPVWFDIYMPRDFDKIRLEFTYKNDYNYKIEVGPKIYEQNNPLQVLDDGSGQLKGFKAKDLEFDLKNLPITRGKLRFMITAPGLKSGEELKISNLKIILLRKSIWQEGIFTNLAEYFDYYENKFK